MYTSSEGLVVKVVGMQIAKQHIQKVVPLRNVHTRLFVQIVSQKELHQMMYRYMGDSCAHFCVLQMLGSS